MFEQSFSELFSDDPYSTSVYTNPTSTGEEEEPPVQKTFLQCAEQVVCQHLDDDTFGVKELSTALYLSPSQVYRKIKAQTGGSPSAFINGIRLRVAKKMLLETDQTITEIAYRVGFNDITYFAHCFRKHYGQTATTMRRDTR